MGQPAGGKARQKLDIHDKVKQPPRRKHGWIFYDSDFPHASPRADFARIVGAIKAELGRSLQASENFEVFPVFPVGHSGQEPGDFRPFDVQEVVDELAAQGGSEQLAGIERA